MADFKFEDSEVEQEAPAPTKPVPPSMPVPPVAPQAPSAAPAKPTQANSAPSGAPASASPSMPKAPPAPKAPVASKTASKAPASPRAPAAPQAATQRAPAAPQDATQSAPAHHAPQAPVHHAPQAPAALHTPMPPAAPAVPNAPVAPGERLGEIAAVGARANVRRVLDIIDPYVEWIFRVAAIAGVLALGFVLLIVFSGNIAHLGENKQAADVLRNLALASKVLGWALILGGLSAVILMYDDRSIGVGIGIGGLVLVFGVPWLLMSVVVGKSTSTATVAAASSIIGPLRQAGFVLTALGMLKGLMDLMVWFTELPTRMKQRADVGVAKKAEPAQQKVAAHANMFSPCWQLPFCREVIRKQCPAFLAKKRCWKFGRGCYCDEEMIARIVRGESLDVIKAPTRMSRQGKPPCGRCYIYLEHQALKFKVLSPLALPLTLLIVFFGWRYYEQAFLSFNHTFEAVLGMISFDPKKLTPDAIKTTEKATTSLTPNEVLVATKYLFGVLGGFFLLIYISKFFEWVVFKAKW